MAEELNMQSKHSIEKQTAHYVDCFTTVSEITNNECRELLDKPADVVLMNGFEDDFVPKGATFTASANVPVPPCCVWQTACWVRTWRRYADYRYQRTL